MYVQGRKERRSLCNTQFHLRGYKCTRYPRGSCSYHHGARRRNKRDAAAVVEAIGPSVQTTSGDVSVMYQGDIIVGRLAMGVGTLNPAAAIELQAA